MIASGVSITVSVTVVVVVGTVRVTVAVSVTVAVVVSVTVVGSIEVVVVVVVAVVGTVVVVVSVSVVVVSAVVVVTTVVVVGTVIVVVTVVVVGTIVVTVVGTVVVTVVGTVLVTVPGGFVLVTVVVVGTVLVTVLGGRVLVTVTVDGQGVLELDVLYVLWNVVVAEVEGLPSRAGASVRAPEEVSEWIADRAIAAAHSPPTAPAVANQGNGDLAGVAIVLLLMFGHQGSTVAGGNNRITTKMSASATDPEAGRRRHTSYQAATSSGDCWAKVRVAEIARARIVGTPRGGEPNGSATTSLADRVIQLPVRSCVHRCAHRERG